MAAAKGTKKERVCVVCGEKKLVTHRKGFVPKKCKKCAQKSWGKWSLKWD